MLVIKLPAVSLHLKPMCVLFCYLLLMEQANCFLQLV